MTKFICEGCGYHFESESQKKCPYCNSSEVSRDLDAEDLIDSMI